MSEVTVKQLAETVGTPLERLLNQMQEAGLAHTRDDELVSESSRLCEGGQSLSTSDLWLHHQHTSLG